MFISPVSDDAIDEALNKVRIKFAMKPHIAISGFGKAGKSSLFNAIYGAKIAKVSMRTDETTETQTKEKFGIDFTDTPGIGTAKFSLEKIKEMGVFDKQHVVIHVLNGAAAISNDDELLHELIENSIAKRVTVINKVDVLDSNEQTEYSESVNEKLGLFGKDFLFISAKKGIGIPKLINHITDILPDAMKDAFVAQQNADLKIKENRVRGVIYSKSSICAAAAAVPVPIADIFVLTPIQIAMISTIGCFHGVEMSKERAIELILTLGAGVGLREAARQLIKLIPGYGQVVSASIAFAGTVALGEAANIWFKNKMSIDAEELKEIFAISAENARIEYGNYSENKNKMITKLNYLKEKFESGDISKEGYESQIINLDME